MSFINNAAGRRNGFEIDNSQNDLDNVIMYDEDCQIHVYTDGSKCGMKTGGGAIVLISAALCGEDRIVQFAQQYPNIFDINVAEARIAVVVLNWVINHYPETTIHWNCDNAQVIERVYWALKRDTNYLCICENNVEKRGREKCNRCQGKLGGSSTSYEIQAETDKLSAT